MKHVIVILLLVGRLHERHHSSRCSSFASGFSPSHYPSDPSPRSRFRTVSATRTTFSSPSSVVLAARKTYYKPRREEEQRRRPSSTGYEDDDYGYEDFSYDSGVVDDNVDGLIQLQRRESSIGCPHFGTCPGCVRDDNVAEIDVVESARLYFSSSSIQKHITRNNGGGNKNARYNKSNINRRNDNNYDDDDEEDDEFYKIKVPSPTTQWRTQAKLAVSPGSTWTRDSGCSIGLYQRNSHDVLSIPDCRVHHPSINRAVDVIVKATQKVRTPGYQEDIGQGLLRYVQLQVETSTSKVCLSLVMNAERFKECQPHLSYLVKELKRADPKLWHSIWCHCNDSRGNAIFARDVTRWHPVDGPPYVREAIPGSDPDKREGLMYFSPYVFRQGNLGGFGEIAREVWEAVPRGSRVCELYAGVGLLGLSALLHHGKLEEEDGVKGGLRWLRCSDENPENARCFDRTVSTMPMHITGRTPKKFQAGGKKKGQRRRNNAKHSGKGKLDGERSIKDLMDSMTTEGGGNAPRPSKDDPSERVTYLQANAASALYRGQALGADVIIVDPPRRGLDEAVLRQLTLRHDSNQPYAEKPAMISHLPRHAVNWTNDARTLIYVSCGFDALARDLDGLLTAKAGWKLESATGYVLFPGSNHVETVVVLRR